MPGKGWIGVDLDGTLAHYTGWQGKEHIGEPVPAMLERVQRWIAEGEEVRIFTARVSCHEPERLQVIRIIEDWLRDVGLGGLTITNVKDFGMRELWDDRAITVEQNTGRILGDRQARFTP